MTLFLRSILIISLLISSGISLAQQVLAPPPSQQVFKLGAKITDQDTVTVTFTIDDDYFLYRERFGFKVISPIGVEVAQPILPPGEEREDDLFGKYQVYHKNIAITLLFFDAGDQDIVFQVNYQGCSESGYCYPPDLQQYKVNFTSDMIESIEAKEIDVISSQDKVTELLSSHHIITVLLGFLGFGLLLTFTPCVLPMIPILSGIIMGQDKNTLTTSKAFRLSLVYVLSMALTYAIAGVLVALLGSNIQAALQNPWVLSIFSLIFVALALAMFGFYDIRLPTHFEGLLARVSHRQKSGSYIGVAIMGCLATLIVSPCVTPPLIGALSYIAQTGNVWLGGIALFTMGIGMGIPLIIIGTLGGKFIPKAGAWMNAVKNIFGVLLLGVAIWLVERIIPGQVSMILWAALLISSAVFMGAFINKASESWHKLWQGLGLVIFVYGIILIIGAGLGNTNPLQPLANLSGVGAETPSIKNQILIVKSIEDVNKTIAQAQQQNKPAMLDFYADWCIACKQMEHKTFADSRVTTMLNNFVVMQADVTANDRTDKALQREHNVVAPPSILFFDKSGNELTHLRIVGEMGPDEFLAHLQAVQAGA